MQTVKQFIEQNPHADFAPEIMHSDTRICTEVNGNGLNYCVEMRGFYNLDELEWLIRDLKQLNATIQTVEG
jgi:hypothetical protein